MLKFSIITLFPDMLSSITDGGLIARAVNNGLIHIDTVDLRQYAIGKRRDVDDRPASGGDGMVIRPDVVQKAILDHKTESSFIIHLSPSGHVFNHNIAKQLSKESHIILLSGRYAGFDTRVTTKYANLHLSIGDFVLSGGEIPAMCIIDSVSRFVPGVLGNEQSPLCDSFENGLLEAPAYTKPIEFEGEKIPDILLSGDHKKINEYQRKEQIRVTATFRPDLIKKVWNNLSCEEQRFAQSINPSITTKFVQI